MLCDLKVAKAEATPGGGLQLRGACCGPAGSDHKINCTISCIGLQSAGNGGTYTPAGAPSLPAGRKLSGAEPAGEYSALYRVQIIL